MRNDINSAMRAAALPAAGVVVLSIAILALADEPEDVPAPERAERRALTMRILDELRISVASAANGTAPTRSAEPLLRYTDNTRLTSDSTLWLWGATGRPLAIVAIEHYPKNPDMKHWLCEVASLSDEPISVAYGSDIDWTASKPGLELAALEGAPVPAGQPSARLTQIKQLQRRFSAHEKEGTEGRLELRLLAKPLHRYQDVEAGIVDGAIVAFVNGTNPEVLLVIEARKTGQGAPEWQFGLVQMTGAAVSAELDGREIWTRQEANPPARRDAYLNAWISPPDE